MNRRWVRSLLSLGACLLLALSADNSHWWAGFGVFAGAFALRGMTQPWIDQTDNRHRLATKIVDELREYEKRNGKWMV